MTRTPPRPWLALVLSLFCTGLGHLYCGRLKLGLALFLVSLLFPAIAIGAIGLTPSSGALTLLTVGVIAIAMVYLGGAAHAWSCARRGCAGSFALPGPLAALFVAVGLTYPGVTGMLLRGSVVRAYLIATDSMAPTLRRGDRILVTKLGFDGKVARGDAICFRAPGERAQHWVKRVIAIEGDRVRVEEGRVWLNGEPVDRVALDERAFRETIDGATYRIQLRPDAPAPGDYGETAVPSGHCFVLGDDRRGSRDSRSFGFVPLGDVIGPAAYIFWPIERWSRWGAVDAQ